MKKGSAIVTTRAVLYGEIHQLLNLENSISQQQLLPKITYREVEKAISSEDCIRWIYYGNQLAGYFWFERKVDYLYIARIVIQQAFQEKGISSHIQNLAQQKVAEWQFSKCQLAVHPMNEVALNDFFKHQYYIVHCVPDFFGLAFINSFRCIMEKNIKLTLTEKVNEPLQIPCHDYIALKKATDNQYIGIGLVNSYPDKSIVFNRNTHYKKA